MRQLLADKVSGSLMGSWLLVPELLSLGVWDLVCGWTGQSQDRVEPRLALQLINEAALCVTGLRQQRTLSQRGFEVACGLPFIATDQAIHDLLAAHTVHEAQELQVTLGQLRALHGHFSGQVLAIDPHRIRSYSKRQMRRFQHKDHPSPQKRAQTFFCLDADTGQPLAFTTATASRTVAQATPGLLDLTARILRPQGPRPLVLADTEHVSDELFRHVVNDTPFDLLTPQARRKSTQRQFAALSPESWTPRWAGYATQVRPYHFAHSDQSLYQFLQRTGETPATYDYKAFVCTAARDEVDALTLDFPKRWHIEEFFHDHQHLGWNRAGTQNLNIRYGQMSMALVAQAALHELRRRLAKPCTTWDAQHLARHLLAGLDGDLRVYGDTILVTFYNAPNVQLLRQHYEDLPQKLEQRNIDPRVPWLYNFKLDFRFQ